MNYNEMYSQPNYTSQFQPLCSPPMLLKDPSGTVSLINPMVVTPLVPPVPYVSLGQNGPAGLPSTTPAPVLPPSPPVLTMPLPHVYVSDHSEIHEPLDSKAPENTFGTTKSDLTEERILESSPPELPCLVRRASEPAALPSVAVLSVEEKPKRFHRSMSYAPTTNQWCKRAVVCVICALVIGLMVKIGVELWKASYGDNSSTSVVP